MEDWECTNIFEILPPGDWKIIRHTKYGTCIKKGRIKIFIPKTEVNIEELEKKFKEQ